MKCEFCNSEMTVKFASGRFCNRKCANSFVSNQNLEEKNKKRSEKLKGKSSPLKGRSGRKPSKEETKKISDGLKKYYDSKGRITIEQKRLKIIFRVNNYRARKIKATPDSANLELIKKIYENCPSGYHVDHIHSLAKGGLHHENNLQYLPISENCRKCADREYDKSLAIDWRNLIK